ncbi:MAG: DnaD domain protein, partial [Clostridia bacterium]|nr:DnaD domain protein [Clostridia bacterium]
GIRPADADAAVAFWRGAGIFREDDSAEKKPVASPSSLFKSYDSETIQKQLEDPAFRECCDLVAEKLEKAQLTKNDLSSLVYLRDYVGLPPAMISGVAEYSVSRGKKSMQYLMTTALKMYQEDGIDTYEKFESHMARLEKLHSDVGRFRTMCGFGDRELSSKESSLLNRWFFEYGLPFDVVRMGYDRMIDSIGKVRMSYLDTILKRWFDAGLTTAEAVEAEDKKPENPAPGYGTSGAFFEAALNAGFEEPVGDKKNAKAEHGEEDAP